MTTLSELEGSAAWRTLQEPRVMFCLDDGHTISFLFMHLGKGEEYQDTLTIEAGKGKIEILGPKASDLHRDFCKGKCTMIKADGSDIVSVKCIAT
jgi:hypothetical protein